MKKKIIQSLVILTIILMGGFWGAQKVHAAGWEYIGQPGFDTGYTAGTKNYTNLAFDKGNGEPYVAFIDYSDATNGSKLKVLKYSGDSWQSVGDSDIKPGAVSLAFNPQTNEPYVAYTDISDDSKVVVQKYSGGSWQIIGDTSVSMHGTVTLAFNPKTNEPLLAIKGYEDTDSSLFKVRVIKFDSTSWQEVGSTGFGATGYGGSPPLVFHPTTGEPYIAYNESDSPNSGIVKKFSNSSWQTVGSSGIDALFLGDINLAFQPFTGDLYVGCQTLISGFYKASVIKLSGDLWEQVGNPGLGIVSSSSPFIAFQPVTGDLYTAYYDGAYSDKGIVKKYSEGSWQIVGDSELSSGRAYYLSLAFHPTTNEPYVAFYDEAKSGASVMKYAGAAPPPPTQEQYSSVAFFPGLMGSRLYMQDSYFENQLWEPNRNADVEKLYLNDDGKSVDSIYTRDIIDKAHYAIDIYSGFMDYLNNELKDKKLIHEWKQFPYDWRLSTQDTINGIKKDSNGYEEKITDELKRMASDSGTKKVTIVAHSNGGLLAKDIINALGNQASNYIDKIIFVASPQIGTPKAIEGLLHADTQQMGISDWGFLMDEERARTLADNMPTAYNLLPSKKYFERITSSVIEFDKSVDKLSELRSRANTSISNYEDLNNFLSGDNGARSKPNYDNEAYPNVVNGKLLEDSSEFHDQSIDDWEAPEGIEAFQIVGWGLDTIKGIQYNCGFFCNSTSSLDRELKFTYAGDGTVVYPSASYLDTKTYYYNLPQYNLYHPHWNRSHADILEVNDVQALIGNIATESLDDGSLPANTWETVPPGNVKGKRIVAKSPIQIDVIDDGGKHVGLIDPLISDTDLRFYEAKLPNSYYLESAGHTFIGFSDEQDKEYMLGIKGIDFGTFTLEIKDVFNDEEIKQDKFIDIPVTSETKGHLKIVNDVVSGLNLDVNGDGVNDFDIAPGDHPDKEISLNVFRKIITSSDIDFRVKRLLIRYVRLAERLYSKGNDNQGDRILTKLTNKIKIYSTERIHKQPCINKELADKLIEILEKIKVMN